jgi:hypothetical protein
VHGHSPPPTQHEAREQLPAGNGNCITMKSFEESLAIMTIQHCLLTLDSRVCSYRMSWRLLAPFFVQCIQVPTFLFKFTRHSCRYKYWDRVLCMYGPGTGMDPEYRYLQLQPSSSFPSLAYIYLLYELSFFLDSQFQTPANQTSLGRAGRETTNEKNAT